MSYTKEEQQLLDEKYAGTVTDAFAVDCARLTKGEPLAYVIGTQPFLGLSIHLDSRPLIPRPETEDWTEKAIQMLLQESGPVSVLDLCAGSGAIGCAVLKHVPQAEVWFAEQDPAHEKTIQKNIEANNLDASRAHIVSGDLFAPLKDKKFSFILTNPPYIPEDRVLPDSVTAYEPHTALFSGPDGLTLIRRIASSAQEYLLPGGQIWLECDTEHVEGAARCFWGRAYRVDIRKDQYGRPRYIVGYYP